MVLTMMLVIVSIRARNTQNRSVYMKRTVGGIKHLLGMTTSKCHFYLTVLQKD